MNNNANLIGNLLSKYRFNFSNETELQNGIEGILISEGLIYEREVRLSLRDRPDFVIQFSDVKIAIEVKIAGTKNTLLRQISRYLKHESINGVFVVGTPYWINQLPSSLSDKPIWNYRLMGSLL